MSRYIDPFTDFGFKYIFGQEDSKDYLIDFLNDLLEGERVITDLSYMDKEQLADAKDDRTSVYDIYCTTDTGERIIVEMQKRNQKNFKDRALFYMSKAIVAQGKKGMDWEYDYNAVYGVFFMDFAFKDSDKFRTNVVLADEDTGKKFSNKMKQIFLALPKFEIENPADCKTGFDKWIYTLKNMPMLSTMPFEKQKAIFAKLGEKAETGQLSKEDREKYEYSLKVARDNYSVMKYAEETAEARGEARGMAKGRTEGRAEGIAEAEEKYKQEKIASAKGFKKIGVPDNEIASILGLPLEVVVALS